MDIGKHHPSIRNLHYAEEIAAIGNIAHRINASLNLRETLDTIVNVVSELIPCSLAEIDLWDDVQQMLVLQAIRSTPERSYPVGQSFPPGRGYTGWVVDNRQPLLVPDVESYPDLHPDILPGELPFKAYLGFPLLEGDMLIGVLVLVHDQPGAFNGEDLQLLDVLASQAAIAIHNARIYDELARHHRELSALYSVAEAINRPLELQNLLESALDSVMQVTRADGAAIRLLDSFSNEAVLAANRGLPEKYIQQSNRIHVSQDIVGEVIRSGKAALSDDLWVDARISPKTRELLIEVGHRSLAQVPLVAQERVVGVLGIVAKSIGFFTEDDLKLLVAIGQQLGVAIDNAQLFAEIKRKARKLSALNAVATVVNQPLSLQEIMDQAITKVIEVMETEAGGIRLLNQQTGELPIVASRGLSDELIQSTRSHHLGEGIVGDVAQSGKPQVIKDVSRDERVIDSSILVKEGFNTLAVVPLRAKDKTVGTLGVVTRKNREFTPEDMELLSAIGDQIGVAVENARLYSDLARHVRHLEAVYAVAKVVNRTKDLDQILNEGLKQTLAVVGVDIGWIALVEPKEHTLSVQTSQGMSRNFINWLAEKLKSKLLESDPWPSGIDIYIEEPSSIHAIIPREVLEEGLRLYAEVPLFAEGDFVGVLFVASRYQHFFNDEEKALLQAIGHQLGTAIADARLRQEALQTERLAAIGQVATGVAHDLRSPLGGILRSVEFLSRPEISPETRRKLCNAVISLAQRLISTSQGILDYVQGENFSLILVPCCLSDFLDEVLTVLEVDFSDRGIEVERDFNYTGNIVIDANRMAQVVYNLAANARDAMPLGGKFSVGTRKIKNNIEIHFSDNGPGVPKELSSQIFEPFFSYGKGQGAGLGLAIARRIVEEHGGIIKLICKAKRGATFVIRLPA